MNLPTEKQSITSAGVDPLNARVLLAGLAKAGKSTLFANWAPDTSLFIDTHKGTTLLPGEHYAVHVTSWEEFVKVVDQVVSGQHAFKTIGIDVIEDIWKMADLHAAQKKGVVAAGLVEYGKGTAEAEGLFRQQVGRLLASPYGIWFLAHCDSEEHDKGITRVVPKLDKRVRTYIEGAVQYVWLMELLGVERVVHTQPSARFGAGSRTPLPEPFPVGADVTTAARNLWLAMDMGLNPAKYSDVAPIAATADTAPEAEKVEVAA